MDLIVVDAQIKHLPVRWCIRHKGRHIAHVDGQVHVSIILHDYGLPHLLIHHPLPRLAV